MAYNLKMTSYLSGATVNQLQGCSRRGLLVPEVNPARPKLYSFRDLVAARSVARLRAFTSLQSITKAIRTLNYLELEDHLSTFRFGYDGRSIKVWTEGNLMDIEKQPGQFEIFAFRDIYAPFENFRGRDVPDLMNPSKGITVNPRIFGGKPTIAGTRVTYDTLAGYSDLIEEGANIEDFYPFLTSDDVKNAVRVEQDFEAYAG